jgi:hypothetical protein
MPAQPGGSEKSCPYHITFDMTLIEELKQRYEEHIQVTADMLPKVNWNSTQDIKRAFKEYLSVELNSAKISDIEPLIERFDHDSEEFDFINGVTMLLRLKYTVANYLNCVIRHEENGKINLRYYNGKICFPNRRPLSHNEEFNQCIMHTNLKGATHGSK